MTNIITQTENHICNLYDTKIPFIIATLHQTQQLHSQTTNTDGYSKDEYNETKLLSADKHAVDIKFIVTSIHVSTLDIKKITVERKKKNEEKVKDIFLKLKESSQ
jgi:hypothetical protein